MAGINMDEEKRRLQYMQFRAEQKLEAQQEVDFKGRRPVRDVKKLLVTAGIVLGLLLAVLLLGQSGVL